MITPTPISLATILSNAFSPPFFASVFLWWFLFFVIGLLFLPVAARFFSPFFDKGYIFAKILGIAFISYTIFVLATLHILPFNQINAVLICIFFGIVFLFLIARNTGQTKKTIQTFIFSHFPIFFLEEIIFFLCLLSWSYVRATQPNIQGLEKYMDFGFVNSILRSDYFPPKDMWFTPFSINYYYFGHLVTAVLTKLSGIESLITYNLMIATLFAFSFVAPFSLCANLLHIALKSNLSQKKISSRFTHYIKILLGGFLSGFFVALAGNLHTLYTFFKPYKNENPIPLWQLAYAPQTFPNTYWYPNATRFISNTIHEFPIYSSVVADLHGHFLDIPFVMLTIALLFSLFIRSTTGFSKNNNRDNSFDFLHVVLIGFLLAIMYMTNAWDGIIYFLLTIFVVCVIVYKNASFIKPQSIIYAFFNRLIKQPKISAVFSLTVLIGSCFFLFALPFSLHFKPFVSGIGILCAPEFLTKIGHIGPFLFEADHCQRSPLWQLFVLYGFFYVWVILFFTFLLLKKKSKVHALHIKNQYQQKKPWYTLSGWTFDFNTSNLFIFLLIILATLLIYIPEAIYVKDIYPAHYRANTMFKLVYQSFMMLGIISGFIIIQALSKANTVIYAYVVGTFQSLLKERKTSLLTKILHFFSSVFLPIILYIMTIYLVHIVTLYRQFAIGSYYENLKTFRGLNGTAYLKTLYPTDYEAILWINKNISKQPVIVEAQGDSYTDYARISSNTGLPTLLGWTVHEWLWRGSYDIPSPRIAEVKTIYESKDIRETKDLLKKYQVSLIFVGDLERKQYPQITEKKFQNIGKIIYQKGQTKIYKL